MTLVLLLAALTILLVAVSAAAYCEHRFYQFRLEVLEERADQHERVLRDLARESDAYPPIRLKEATP